VGSRMSLGHTRSMIKAALAGELDHVETETDPVFGLHMPKVVMGVPSEVLNPRNTWSDKKAYDAQAEKLAGMFKENFEKFAAQLPPEVKAAGPR